MITKGNPGADPIRVLIVDDHPAIQKCLCNLLNDDQSMEVVGQARSGFEALEMVKECQPEVVIMDYSMPGMSGIEATRLICHDFPKIHVIAYSSTDIPYVMDQMFKAGAERFCTKGGSPLELLNAIHQVVPHAA